MSKTEIIRFRSGSPSQISSSVLIGDNLSRGESVQFSPATSATSIHQPSQYSRMQHDLAALKSAINEAEWIGRLEDNWDDEGTPGYSTSTFERLKTTLVRNLDSAALGRKILNFSKPSIVPGPSRQIDVFWDSPRADCRLSIYFPADPDEMAEFHFRERSGRIAQGLVLPPSRVDPILVGIFKEMFAVS